MDWLRRNWPDLIIAVALVAVIAMIVATLLGGSPLLSFGGSRDTAGNRVEQPPAVQDAQNPEQNSGQNPEQDPESPAASGNGDNAQQGGIEPVVPDLPGSEADANTPGGAPGDAQTDESAPQDAAAGSAPSADEPAAEDVTAVDPATGDEVTASEGVAGETGETPAAEQPGVSYRVSVGAFSSREGAQSLTERYSAEGFPTLIASQGDLSLALIGPYASEAEANRVAQQIVEGGGEALVYSYEPDLAEDPIEAGLGEGAEAQDPVAPQEVASQENVSQDVSQEPAQGSAALGTPTGDAAQSSGTFLQVGAFGSSDSAQTRRERIEELGYGTSERETAAGLVRLFVGPLGPGETEEAQARLQTLGIDSFPVSIP